MELDFLMELCYKKLTFLSFPPKWYECDRNIIASFISIQNIIQNKKIITKWRNNTLHYIHVL